jgi:DNA polymerase
MPVLYRDYETRSVADIRECGGWQYIMHPSTDVWCCAFAVDDQPVQLWIPGQPVPPDFITAADDPAWAVSSFNDAFERLIETHVMAPRYGWPAIPLERHRCSQAVARAHALPASLKAAAAALGLAHQKADDAAMRKLARPRKPRKGEPAGLYWHDDPALLERLYNYCRRDVACERELAQRLAALPPDELAIWRVDQAINDRGFYTDGPLLAAAARIAEAADEEILRELRAVTGDAIDTIGQVDLIIAWLADNGCLVKDLRRGTIAAALRRKGLPPAVRRVLELRLGGTKASARKLATWQAWRNADGRIRHAFNYHGAGTGRWSSYGVQAHNLRRTGTADVGAAIALVMAGDFGAVKVAYPDSPLSAIGDVMRAVPCAAPGHRLLVADLSGIESRVVAWLSGQSGKLDQWRKFDATGDLEDDPYYRFGRDRLGLPPDQARAAGKIADLAFGYGGSTGAWQNFAGEGDSASEAEIKRTRDTWRAAHPWTTRYWRALDEAAVRAVRRPGKIQPVGRLRRIAFDYVGDFLWMTLPSGRRLAYPFPKLKTGKFGGPMVSFLDSAEGKWTDCRHGHGFYGGAWLENAVSAVARDIFAAAMLRLEAAGYRIVMHIHDEIVAEMPDDVGSVEEFERLIVTLPAWAADLPVACKVRNGQRFAKVTPASDPPPNGAPQPADDPGLEAADEDSPADPGPGPAGARSNGHDEEAARAAPPPPPGGSRGDDDSEANSDKPFDDRTLRRQGYQFICAYDYTLPGAAEPSYQACKYVLRGGLAETPWRPRKRFLARRPDGNGGWLLGAGTRRIPYNYAGLIAAGPGMPVLVTEGEKNADDLIERGLLATTVLSHKWAPSCAATLLGMETMVLADHDEQGEQHAAAARRALQPYASSVRVVPTAHLWTYLDPAQRGNGPRPGDDVSDWLELGGDASQLIAICRTISLEGSIKEINIRAWDREPVPEQQWAVPDRFPLRQTVLFSGEGAVGKGYATLQLSCAQALGAAWLGIPLPQAPALFIDAEDDADVLHYRSAAIARHHGVTYSQLADGGLHLVSWFGEDAVLAAPDRRSSVMEPTALYWRLLEMVGDIKPRTIAISSASDVFAGSEIDRAQVRQFINLLNRIAVAANGTVVLTSHPSLTGINTGTGISGSTQWHNGPRARAVMSGVKPESGEAKDSDLRKIEFFKNQYGRLTGAIYVRWQNGLFVPVSAAAADDVERMQRVETIFLELLRRYTGQGQKLSPYQGGTCAASVFARDPDAAGLTYKDFQTAQQRLLDAGQIEIKTEGPPSHQRSRLAIKA